MLFIIKTSGQREHESTRTKSDSPNGNGPHRSACTTLQGRVGICVMMSGGGLGCGPCAWHEMQERIKLSTSLSIPGHQTFSRISCLVRTIPWCPSCASWSVVCRRLDGITMRDPRSTKLPNVESSSLMLKNERVSLVFCHFPEVVYSWTSLRTGSFFVLSSSPVIMFHYTQTLYSSTLVLVQVKSFLSFSPSSRVPWVTWLNTSLLGHYRHFPCLIRLSQTVETTGIRFF